MQDIKKKSVKMIAQTKYAEKKEKKKIKTWQKLN